MLVTSVQILLINADDHLECVGGYLPFVAFTVHKRVYPPVEQIVLGAEALDPVRTVSVVLPATAVRPRVAPHLHVPLGQGALATVLGARYNKHTR